MSIDNKNKIANHLHKVLKPILKRKGFSNAKIITEWQTIVGAEIANLCYPIKIQFEGEQKTRGTILISVNNPGATLYLQGMAPVIIDRINGFLGYNAVKNLKTVMQEAKSKINTPSHKYFFAAKKKKINESSWYEIENIIDKNCKDHKLKEVLNSINKNIFVIEEL